jgi:hypothetical protein
MEMLKIEALQTLMEHTDEPCISMFLPMERAGKETRQNPIRFKNMVGETEERLGNSGMEAHQVQALLKPARELLNDPLFWQYQNSGFAFFRSPSLVRFHSLPLAFEELLVISNQFHIKPLLPMFSINGHFYILALSQNQVRLLHATRYHVETLELPEDMPTSMAEALSYDDAEKQLQFRTNVPGGQGQAPAFHGHQDTDERVNLLRYFLEIDRGIQAEYLSNQQAPLVLAGVDYIQSFYHERNTYRNLLEQGIEGNPDLMKPEELHAEAWKIVEPYFARDMHAAVEQFHERLNHNRASHDLREVIPAACYGRIETLFVPVGVQKWGSFDMETNTLDLHEEARTGSRDLLDLAAVQTISQSGTVYAVEPEQVPAKAPAAALFRY